MFTYTNLTKINSKTLEGTSRLFEYIYGISVRVLDLKRLELILR